MSFSLDSRYPTPMMQGEAAIAQKHTKDVVVAVVLGTYSCLQTMPLSKVDELELETETSGIHGKG